MSNLYASLIGTGAGLERPPPPRHRPAHGGGHFSRPGTGTRSREACPAVLCFALCGRCRPKERTGFPAAGTFSTTQTYKARNIQSKQTRSNADRHLLFSSETHAYLRSRTYGLLEDRPGYSRFERIGPSRRQPRAGKSFFSSPTHPPTSS